MICIKIYCYRWYSICLFTSMTSNIWQKQQNMTQSISHAISTLDQYQPSNLHPSGWYWSLGLIWHAIQICYVLFSIYHMPVLYMTIFVYAIQSRGVHYLFICHLFPVHCVVCSFGVTQKHANECDERVFYRPEYRN